MFDEKYLEKNYLRLIDYYGKAANITNVPAIFLASLHYRESSFSTDSVGPGGPFQFDPPLSAERTNQFLKNYTTLDNKTIAEYEKKGQNDFFVGLILAGCFVQAKLKYDKKQLLVKDMSSQSNSDLIMRAFELYNGTGYGSAWKSPYVVNMLDANHMKMRIRGSYIDKKGIRRFVNTVDTRPGAYTVLKILEKYQKKLPQEE